MWEGVYAFTSTSLRSRLWQSIPCMVAGMSEKGILSSIVDRGVLSVKQSATQDL